MIVKPVGVLMLFLLSIVVATGCSPVEDSIGAACVSDDQCPDELFCSASSPRDVCAAACSSDSDCAARFGSEFHCVNGNSRCARLCERDADCAELGSSCARFTSGNSYCAN